MLHKVFVIIFVSILYQYTCSNERQLVNNNSLILLKPRGTCPGGECLPIQTLCWSLKNMLRSLPSVTVKCMPSAMLVFDNVHRNALVNLSNNPVCYITPSVLDFSLALKGICPNKHDVPYFESNN